MVYAKTQAYTLEEAENKVKRWLRLKLINLNTLKIQNNPFPGQV